ncbi:16S rRNA (guanine(527)-N(7))-methyltransferase RsmG [Deinococcus roseus]|uniref:16S rRNA (guanine(527)-N(7))-methyltransferase RsmG n=1 Tax=Deinococcus roseus TaxID=392414 RepID=UPI001E34ABA9|nr:RsmG family class I SAM-dependent methyltransferase [Deinococcus roseus]
MKQKYKALVKQYSRSLDLFGPSVEIHFDMHMDSAEEYAKYIPEGETLLDVGSGGGLPGIPIALARPDIKVILCEIRQRRASFLNIARSQLGLSNVRIFAGDVRKFKEPVSWVTAQAVGDLGVLLKLIQHTVTDEWHLLSRRPKDWVVPEKVGPYSVEQERQGLDEDADLVVLHLSRK